MPFFLNFALDYAIRRVQVNQYGFKLNGTHQIIVCTDDLIYWVVVDIKAMISGSLSPRHGASSGCG